MAAGRPCILWISQPHTPLLTAQAVNKSKKGPPPSHKTPGWLPGGPHCAPWRAPKNTPQGQRAESNIGMADWQRTNFSPNFPRRRAQAQAGGVSAGPPCRGAKGSVQGSPSGAQAGYSSIDWGHIRKKTMSPSCWTTVSSASVQIFHRGSAASRRVCTKSCPLVCSSSRKR